MSDSEIIPRTMFVEEFLPLKGQTFLADCDPKTAEMILCEVIAGRQAADWIRPSFTLIFRSKPNVLLVTGMYKMKCGRFGPEVIYVEQIGAPSAGAPAGHYYQAIFN